MLPCSSYYSPRISCDTYHSLSPRDVHVQSMCGGGILRSSSDITRLSSTLCICVQFSSETVDVISCNTAIHARSPSPWIQVCLVASRRWSRGIYIDYLKSVFVTNLRRIPGRPFHYVLDPCRWMDYLLPVFLHSFQVECVMITGRHSQ